MSGETRRPSRGQTSPEPVHDHGSAAEPIAWVRGRWVPLSEAVLPLADLGLQGMAVTETIRTFRHLPFRLDDHLDRLERSLELACISSEISRNELHSVAAEVVAHNANLISSDDDLGLTIFVTAGLNATYLGRRALDECRRPTVGVHTWPLPFELWAERFRQGQHLVTPAVRQLPGETLDPRIKSRSRLHWHVADRQAREVDPHASALLLDREGFITETATANFFIVREATIFTPRAGTVLAGVSQKVVGELAGQLSLEYREADLRPDDVYGADEAFTSSTPYCLMPVVLLNNRSIGAGRPGPVFGRLALAWGELVGVDVCAQICRQRGTGPA